MTNTELKHEAEKLIGADELARKFRVWITGVIRQARRKAENASSEQLIGKDVQTILDDLNMRTKRRFGATDHAKHLIRELLFKGYTVQDFQRVHEVKCAQWLGNDTMDGCLRPSTLYRPSHFDEYLGEWDAMNRKKVEAEEKRALSNARINRGANVTKPAPFKPDKAWWEFNSFYEFMRYTMAFLRAEDIIAYNMPDRLRAIRQRPGMCIAVVQGKTNAEAEKEYDNLKKEAGHASNY